MRSIGAAKFKEQCLAILDDLDPEGLIVTKHGKPVARVTPFSDPPIELIGSMRGRIQVHGDVFSTGVRWDAES